MLDNNSVLYKIEFIKFKDLFTSWWRKYDHILCILDIIFPKLINFPKFFMKGPVNNSA